MSLAFSHMLAGLAEGDRRKARGRRLSIPLYHLPTHKFFCETHGEGALVGEHRAAYSLNMSPIAKIKSQRKSSAALPLGSSTRW